MCELGLVGARRSRGLRTARTGPAATRLTDLERGWFNPPAGTASGSPGFTFGVLWPGHVGRPRQPHSRLGVVVLGPLVMAALGVLGIVGYETRRVDPLLELRFFRSVSFSAAALIAMTGLCAFGCSCS